MHFRLNRFFRIVIISSIALTMFPSLANFSLASMNDGLKNFVTCKWAYSLVDNYCIKQFGSQDANSWVVEKAHEFLYYLNVDHADQIKIRTLEVPSQPMNLNFDKLPAITLWTGLWFNANLENSEETLWHIAHESAHFALKHPLKNLFTLKARPWLVAGGVSGLVIGGTSILFKNSGFCSSLLKNGLAGLISAPIIVQIYVRMLVAGFNAEKEYEREADLMAAKMLCEHGYALVVERHIAMLNKYIEQQIFIMHPHAHPSLVETRDYLQEFWSEWLAEHPEQDLV